MIEYVPYSGEPEAMNCPVVICDTCRKQIVGEGLAVWRIKLRVKGEPRQQTPLYTTHKRECEQALHRRLDGQYSLDENWIDFSEEIDVFLKQLSKNINRSLVVDPAGL
ncbi:hypothetical protein ACWD7F_36950 [Streptomyces sp. NPDC005122]